MRTYNKAPLPFLGQKRYWLTELREQKLFREPELVIVDLFGGSGLVSHTLKQVNSASRVIWNDYDNYLERLAMINETEALRLKLREYAHIKTRSRVGESDKSQMAAAIKEHWKQYGRCDWITLSSWLLYSGNYAHDYDDLVRRGWYYSVIKSPLSADGYLKGVERVCEDFRSLYERYKDHENAIFIADPPYIMTNQTGYTANSDQLFRLKDAVELIQKIHDKRALLFSSPKSETDSLLEVFVPTSLYRKDFATNIGRTRIRESLYFINW